MGKNNTKRHKLKGRSTSYSNERMGENTRKTREREEKWGAVAALKGVYEMVWRRRLGIYKKKKQG